MTGRRRPARKRTQAPGPGQIIAGKLAILFGNWLRLTFTDRASVLRSPVQIRWINVAVVGSLVGLFYTMGATRALVVATLMWFLVTLGRSAAIMPKRHRVKEELYSATQKMLGNPLGTPNRPAPVSKTVRVKRWVGQRIEDVTIKAGDSPATKGEFTHPVADKHVITCLGSAPEGFAWVVEWPANNRLHAHLEPEDSPVVGQQTTRRTVVEVLTQIMKVNSRDAGSYSVQFSGWEGFSDASGRSRQVPGQITVGTGPQFDSSLPANRETFVRSFDRQFVGPGEWIYTWDAATVMIAQADRDSAEAKRKRAERKVGDDAQGALRTRAKDPAVTTVTQWDDDEQTVDHPREIEVDFGTRNMADRRVRAAFEAELDTSLSATYPESEWLYDWRPGPSTILVMTAVPAKSDEARRKRAESRLRNVVEAKFGKAKNFVDCDVLEWSEDTTESGEAIPQKARVAFGTLDVSKIDTRDEFEQHWDSLSNERDWHYKWSASDGEVIIDAVPPLQNAVAFPTADSQQFNTLMRKARSGKFYIGPQKGGGERYWDFNRVPHGLYGGKTGSGKTIALNIIFFFAAYNPDLFEIIVCDPKEMDFTWTPEFPAVIKFATTDEEITAAVTYAHQQMKSRKKLLGKVGVRNVGQMRELYRKNPSLEETYGPVPRRLIVLIDEIGDFLAQSADDETEELKKQAKVSLEGLGRLARAMEVNLVTATQKPDAKIISTQLSSQLEFRLGAGVLDQYESQQILKSLHGTRFPEEGTPAGRAWAYDSKSGYRMVQVPYIPDEDEPCPWDPTVQLSGLKPMLRQRMRDLGYEEVSVPNDVGGEVTRWRQVESTVDEFLAEAGIDYPAVEESSDSASKGHDASQEVLWPNSDDDSDEVSATPVATQTDLTTPDDTALDPTTDKGTWLNIPGWKVRVRRQPIPPHWNTGK